MWVNSANTVLAQEQAKEVRCIRIWIGKKKKTFIILCLWLPSYNNKLKLQVKIIRIYRKLLRWPDLRSMYKIAFPYHSSKQLENIISKKYH